MTTVGRDDEGSEEDPGTPGHRTKRRRLVLRGHTCNRRGTS